MGFGDKVAILVSGERVGSIGHLQIFFFFFFFFFFFGGGGGVTFKTDYFLESTKFSVFFFFWGGGMVGM